MDTEADDNCDVSQSTTAKDEPSSSSAVVSPSPSVPQIMHVNEHKAGLVGFDKEKINKIIQETSKGSAFYNHQQTRQKRINKKIEEHKLALSKAQHSVALAKADSMIAQLEQERSLNRIHVHFDMDMFFAAVEIKHNPRFAIFIIFIVEIDYWNGLESMILKFEFIIIVWPINQLLLDHFR